MKHITETDLNGIPLVAGQLASEVLAWDGNNWVNASNGVPIDNCIFVAKNGNDGNGEVGDLKRPFLTISAAELVASSGQTIVVFPGDYTDSGLGKNGVNYHFMRGAKVSAVDIFTTKGNNQVYRITGEGEFVATGNVSSTSRIVYLSHTGCTVTLSALKITGTDARLFWLQLATDTLLTVNVIEDIVMTNVSATNQKLIACYGATSNIFIKARRIYNDLDFIIMGSQSTGTEITIRAEKIIKSTSPSANYYSLLDVYTGKLNIYADISISSNSNYSIADMWLRGVNPEVNLYGNFTSANTFGMFTVSPSSTGTLRIYGTATTSGGGNTVSTANARLYLYGSLITNQSNSLESLYVSNGKALIYGMIKNNENTSDSHGVVVTGGTKSLILRQSAIIYVTNGSAKSVYASAPQTIKTYPGAVSNAALDVNITEEVSTLTVSANVDSE